MSYQVLVLNSGSSSIKFSLFDEYNSELNLLFNGQLSNLGTEAHFTVKGIDVNESINLPEASDHQSALNHLLEWLMSVLNKNKELLVGHRVVHGGTNYSSPVIINPEVLGELKKLEMLAPLHQIFNLSAIEAVMKVDNSILQVACFDTAFHANHRKLNKQFAIANNYYEEGIQRYGFHGLSYEYIAQRLNEIDRFLAEGKVIVAHLGNGSSLCALDQCQSIDSSMGFSALDGLMMGTRCGSIDAGVILYLLEERKMTSQQISDMLYKQSGLLGVSEITNDMDTLLKSSETKAKEAVDLYVNSVVREMGSLITILKGIDGLVFTAGIGENAAEIRRLVCEQFNWLGIELDDKANANNSYLISTEDSFIEVYVIPTNEELMIAQHTLGVLSNENIISLNLKTGN